MIDKEKIELVMGARDRFNGYINRAMRNPEIRAQLLARPMPMTGVEQKEFLRRTMKKYALTLEYLAKN